MLGPPNAQTGTSYTFSAADTTRVVTFNNASPVAVTLPNGATAGFGGGTMLSVVNLGAGQVTITCSSCTITANGVAAATLPLSQGQGADIYGGAGSPAVNYVALPSPTGGGPFSVSNLTVSGTGTFANINGALKVCPGCLYTTPQAAINALPGSGGTVDIAPGTYAGPTSIPNSNTALVCQSWLGCTFSYTTSQTFGFTGSALVNLRIDGIIFDFGGNNAGLTLQNLQYAKIAIQVQNTGSATGLTLISPNGSVPGLNLWNNDFSFLNIQNANTGITLNGDANINTCTSAQNASGAVFNNRFGYIYMSGIANIGLNFTSGVDSNNFDHVFIDLASSNLNGTGIVLASRCVTAGGGVGLTAFAHVTLEANGSPYTGHLFIANGNSEAIFGYLGLSNVSGANAMQFSATAHVMGNVELNNPFGLTTPTHFFTTAETAVAGPLATAGANVYAPTYNWISNEWNGAASVPSTWSFQPSGNSSGIPTFDSMILFNAGTSNSNGFLGLGLQIPNRLIIATQAGHLGIFTHANTTYRTYTFPDASGQVPITPSILISATAPTIAAAGCGGGAASIVVSNGTAAFKVNVGTTPGSACTITMPAAVTGWNCFATDITTNSTSVFLQKQTGAESQTSVVITNFNDVAVATAFVASDILKVSCHAD